MNKQSGFTLIELVMVIVIIGILAAMAVPRFVDLQGEALTAAQKGSEGAVRSAHAISIAQLKRYPSVTELAGNVQADGAAAVAVASGVQFTINAQNYVVQTYTDTACTPANITTAVADNVACVGSIP